MSKFLIKLLLILSVVFISFIFTPSFNLSKSNSSVSAQFFDWMDYAYYTPYSTPYSTPSGGSPPPGSPPPGSPAPSPASSPRPGSCDPPACNGNQMCQLCTLVAGGPAQLFCDPPTPGVCRVPICNAVYSPWVDVGCGGGGLFLQCQPNQMLQLRTVSNTLGCTVFESLEQCVSSSMCGVVTVDLKMDNSNGPLSNLVRGSTHSLTWTSTNATSCSASGLWNGRGLPANGNQSVVVNSSGIYTLTCSSASGQSNTDSVSVTVAGAPTVNLTMDGSIGPLNNIARGSTHTLAWSSTNATSCATSGLWSGTTVGLSGSQSVVVNSSGSYTLTCSNAGGQSDTKSVTVNLLASPTPTPTPTPASTPTPTSTPPSGSPPPGSPPSGGACNSTNCPPPDNRCEGDACVSIVGQPFPGPGGGGPTDPGLAHKIPELVEVIRRIIGILAPAAAIIFLIMVLMAAFRFIKSTGDPKKIANARDTLKYAAFGVALVAAAWLILTAIQAITGANVTRVDIPGS